MSTEKMFMSIRETARYTGLSEKYLRKRVKTRSIPVTFSGNKALINVPLLLEQISKESEASA